MNDSPPSNAVLSLTLAGAVLGANAVVAVTYHTPLGANDPQLQDLESLKTASFGPVTVTVDHSAPTVVGTSPAGNATGGARHLTGVGRRDLALDWTYENVDPQSGHRRGREG